MHGYADDNRGHGSAGDSRRVDDDREWQFFEELLEAGAGFVRHRRLGPVARVPGVVAHFPFVHGLAPFFVTAEPPFPVDRESFEFAAG